MVSTGTLLQSSLHIAGGHGVLLQSLSKKLKGKIRCSVRNVAQRHWTVPAGCVGLTGLGVADCAEASAISFVPHFWQNPAPSNAFVPHFGQNILSSVNAGNLAKRGEQAAKDEEYINSQQQSSEAKTDSEVKTDVDDTAGKH